MDYDWFYLVVVGDTSVDLVMLRRLLSLSDNGNDLGELVILVVNDQVNLNKKCLYYGACGVSLTVKEQILEEV
ncbi:hypothetical protein [Desulforhopalus sp. 52FAK]